MKSILVATDCSDAANEAIPFVFLNLPVSDTVYVLHVMKEPSTANPMYAHYSRDKFLRPEEKSERIDSIRRSLKELVPMESRGVMRTQVEVAETDQHGEIPNIILRTAEEHGVDAICMVRHKRTLKNVIFAESVSRAVIEKSHIPLVILPSKG